MSCAMNRHPDSTSDFAWFEDPLCDVLLARIACSRPDLAAMLAGTHGANGEELERLAHAIPPEELDFVLRTAMDTLAGLTMPASTEVLSA